MGLTSVRPGWERERQRKGTGHIGHILNTLVQGLQTMQNVLEDQYWRKQPKHACQPSNVHTQHQH